MPAAKTTEVPALDASATTTDVILAHDPYKGRADSLKRREPEKYQEAVTALQANEPIDSIAARMEISPSTLHDVLRAEGLQFWKQRLSGDLGRLIQQSVARLQEALPKIPAGSLPVALGILIDKKSMIDGDQQPHVIEHRVLRVSLKGKLSGLRDGSKS